MTWWLAGQARTPQQLAAEAKAPPRSVITVPVRFETLVRTATLDCRAEPSSVVPVPLAAGEGQGDPVVTALPVKNGHLIGEGRVLVEVSGRPVIVLAGRLPAYRDILPGARGPDVEQLQAALVRLGLLPARRPSGTFDERTRQAVARLYRDHGYPAPGAAPPAGGGTEERDPRSPAAGVTMPRRELLVLPRLPARLGKVATAVGEPARTGDVVVQSGRVVLRCAVPDESAVHGLRRGAPATVTPPAGRALPARVDRIGPAVRNDPPAGQGSPAPDDEPGDEPGREVTLRAGSSLKAGTGYQARIEVEKAAAKGPVVPSSALWSLPGGRTVVKVVRAGRRLEVEVEPGFEVDGQVAISTPAGALAGGDQVLVSAWTVREEPP
ncbi:hypothetical protein DPM19_19300 [Actinomadura craniellae]|uniref:Peptidoglycan binding-like domain-containing protein n=1 Tax=Actinomadura craniellae TaxID=2231787 RepID=A0A365H3W4_9ACTN|nr:peptidoglycan-binding domain-containing protein [Actinomadura craniellae]RAY13800.1 hypothetical protein DPM19_19300 [Actinomadura craniellae]